MHKNNNSTQTNYIQRGFSLIETLVAMTVFSIGFIGVVQFTGEAIKRTANDNSRAISMNAMSQLVTPLYIAALGTPAEFKIELDSFSASKTVASNNNRETYTVSILEAVDDTGASIISDATPANWVSPITVGIAVSYTGATGIITSQAPYTFQLSP